MGRENGRFIDPAEITGKQSLPRELAQDVKDPIRRALRLKWARTVFETVWRAAGVGEEEIQRLKHVFHQRHEGSNPGYKRRDAENGAVIAIHTADILEKSLLPKIGNGGNNHTLSEIAIYPDGNGAHPDK